MTPASLVFGFGRGEDKVEKKNEVQLHMGGVTDNTATGGRGFPEPDPGLSVKWHLCDHYTMWINIYLYYPNCIMQ